MAKTGGSIPNVQTPAQVVAGAFALTGFTVAVVAGMSVGNDANSVITSAIFSMFACYLVGMFVGACADRILRAHVEHYRAAHPIAGSSGAATAVTPPVGGAAQSSTSSSELSTEAKKK